jgi:type IV secretion system protein VirB10
VTALQPPYYGPTAPAPPASGPAIVYRASAAAPQTEAAGNQRAAQRVRAGTFENPATTIPQGALIQAVLETALDSTRAGSARAIVSRDVRSFDGSRVLIPRGSRLYGEYKSDLSAGQNRALIQWTRLMRPDGVVVALDSPSADPLGRAGVKGKVNSHFFQRFSGAMLQSVLDIGVGLATRSIADGTVLVGLPGSTQSIVAPTAPESVRPTLKVAQGTPVSVFVARDLDFTEVEQ